MRAHAFSASLLLTLANTACFDAVGVYAEGGRGPYEDDDELAGSPVVGGASAGGGGASVERCDDGVDGDADSLVDCADPDCGGYVCIAAPAALADWSGPFELAAEGASCSPAWPASISVHLLVDAGAPCGCSCAAPVGAGCSAKVEHSASCGAAGASVEVGTNCQQLVLNDASLDVEVRPIGGSCSAAEAPPAGPPLLSARQLCGGSLGGGCSAEMGCARPSGSERICYAKEGLHACDDREYATQRLVFDGPSPEPSCEGTCTCGDALGGVCSGTLAVFGDTSCAGGASNSIASGGCLDDLSLGAVRLIGPALVTPSACPPSTRDVVWTSAAATTLCCSSDPSD
jgi:hypothetical protein